MGLERYANINNIKSGTVLWTLVDPKIEVKTNGKPNHLIPQIASYLFGKLQESYPKHVNDKLDKNELPLNRPDYLRKRAHQWVVMNCHTKTNKPGTTYGPKHR